MSLPQHIRWQGRGYDLASFQSFLRHRLAEETLASWERSILDFALEWCSPGVYLFEVHTSGSTAQARPVKLRRKAMVASAHATAHALGLSSGQSALLCLSADYIAGKMMIVRALELGMDFYYMQPKADVVSRLKRDYDFAALVPMQVQDAMESGHLTALNKLRCLLVGGDALFAHYLPALRQLDSKIYATYGMTETVTHIALRCLNGKAACDAYQCLEGVSVEPDEEGCLCITAPHLDIYQLHTSDIVRMEGDNRFDIVGRKDFIINTGAIKVSPEAVEQQLGDLFREPYVISYMPHKRLGKAVVLLLQSAEVLPHEQQLLERMKAQLPKYHAPKAIFYTFQLPRNKNGKIDRRQCAMLIEHLIDVNKPTVPTYIFDNEA